MSRLRLLAFALAAYAIALVSAAPATLLDGVLQERSAGALRLAEARGTLWAGTGQLEIRDASRHGGIGTPIAWRLRPAYLLRATLAFEVGLDDAAKRFLVTISPSRIDLADARVNLPAAALSLAMPRLAPLGLTGDMLLHVARLSYGAGGIQGNARLQWRSAGSSFTPVSPLGDYELRVEADGAAGRASLHTLQGPLQLDGEGSWTKGRKPVFRATARVPPQYRQQLVPLMRLISVDRGDGTFTLQ